MIGVAMFITIRTLGEKYKNKTKIAELIGHDWKTVDKMVKAIEAGKEYPARKPYPRVLDSYKDWIMEWLEKEGLNGVRIYEKLRGEGLDISYSAVKEYLALIRRRDEIFIRIETKGEKGKGKREGEKGGKGGQTPFSRVFLWINQKKQYLPLFLLQTDNGVRPPTSK